MHWYVLLLYFRVRIIKCITDINECTAGTHNCHADAIVLTLLVHLLSLSKLDIVETEELVLVCTFSSHSIITVFLSLFKTDINECTAGTDNYVDNCHADATCTNTLGGFNCACKAEFTGNGRSCTGRHIINEYIQYRFNPINNR